ncbi:MAG: tetratricopeptide repeat protein [Gammaproteobacteria bacterium]
MSAYATEHEQLEDLKKWWKENWKPLIAGAVIGLSLIFAYWAWRNHTHTQAEAASAEYQLLIGDVEKGDTPAGMARAARIRNQYADTTYAVFAAMAMAKLALDKGDTKGAREHLEWAMNNAGHENLKHIARLRLARVLLDAGDAKAALKLVSASKPGSFLSAYEEVKGDIYVTMAQVSEASAAYRRALKALGEKANPEKKALIQMKLDDLGSPRAQEKAA